MATTEERLNSLEQQFAVIMTKVDSTLAELKEQREDIRRTQDRHDADIKAIQDRQDADRKALEDKIDRLGDKIQNMVIAAVVGFGAITLAVGGLIISLLK